MRYDAFARVRRCPLGAALLTMPEVAEACRVHVATVRNWARDGRINAIRLPGGTLRVTRAELERILTEE